MTLKRRAFLAAVVSLLGLGGLVCAAGARSAMRTRETLHPPRVVPQRPAAEGPFSAMQDVTLSDPGGPSLSGWYVPTRDGATIVLGHGLGNSRAQLLPEARLLAAAGYGVLLFDWPAHGASGGDQVTWGDRERSSLVAALDWLVRRPEVDVHRIGALGFSMGGSVVASVAARDERLRAIVLEATFSSLEDEMRWSERSWGLVSGQAAVWTIAASGIDLSAVSPVTQICAIAPRPVLVIVNDSDPDAPLDMEKLLVAAACGPIDLLVLPGNRHGGYTETAAASYGERLLGFFKGSLAPRP